MINWPAIIVYEGDDELVSVESEEAWSSEVDSLLYHHKDKDYLIDSSGYIYNLARANDAVKAEYIGEKIKLEAFVRLVRIHASNSHRCCIEKINFRTIAEGIRLINSMNEP